jgi:N-acyl-D-aspartate/D-glutamate deacylase
VIAVKDVNNFGAADNLKQMGNWRRVVVVYAAAEQVDRVIAEKYPERGGSDARAALDGLGSGGAAVSALEGRGESVDLAALEMAANDNAVVQLVQRLLLVAIEDNAIDIPL